VPQKRAEGESKRKKWLSAVRHMLQVGRSEVGKKKGGNPADYAVRIPTLLHFRMRDQEKKKAPDCP